MKRIAYFSANFVLGFAFLFSFILVSKANAQDYLDVPQGFETLNLAVEGDSLSDGTRNPNRVYRLENGGFYVLNGTIINSLNGGFPLHIQAADPNGMPPIIIPGVDEAGNATEPCFSFVEDGSLTGLYVSSLDITGNHIRNNVRLDQDSVKVVIDKCFFDYDRQAPLRANAQEQVFIIKNTIVRNVSRMGTQSTGRCIDIRENLVDSLVVQNCTFFFATGEMINDQGGALMRNLLFDHNTIVGTDNMDSDRIVNGKITNNLFIDVRWEADVIVYTAQDSADGDTLREEILPIDSLLTPLFTEVDREIIIRNNNFAFSPQFTSWVTSVDTVDFPMIHNSVSQRFLAENPKMVSENWIYEYPEFSDPPDFGLLVAWAEYQISGLPEEGTPDIIADRYPNDPDDIPGTYGVTDVLYGLTKDEFKFDYPTTKQSYTHAEGGFPLGDLNWFPDKKAEWETWTTGVENTDQKTPKEYLLAQNYPNPFNPSTTIEYRIAKSTAVSLIIYNLMGQEIRILINKKQPAGIYQIQWDGKDNQMNSVANGVYFYQLKSGSQTMTRKMIMLK
jgi:hypothetical protein